MTVAGKTLDVITIGRSSVDLYGAQVGGRLEDMRIAASLLRGRQVAPHVTLWIVARGINIGLNTRMYFEDEDNAADPVMNLIEQVHRRETLLARKVAPGHYRFDIRLQGDGETVFMDI